MKLVRVVLGVVLIGVLGAGCAGKDGAAGLAGAPGEACTVAKEGAVTTVTCGETVVTVTDGTNGTNGTNGANGADGVDGQDGANGADGAGCTAEKADGVTTVTCGDQVVTVIDGVNGTDGTDGTNGTDGTSCTVAKADGVTTITCGDQVVTVSDGANGTNGTNGTNGADGASCTVAKADGVTTITCGDQIVQVVDGTNGTDGIDGTNGTSCTVATAEDGTKTISCTDGTSATVTDGTDGIDGINGTSCTVVKADGVATITCGDQVVTVVDGTNGVDAEPCTVVRDDVLGTATITCPGSDPVVVTDGADGVNGTNGIDGKPCTILDNLDGTATVTCADGTKTTLGSSNAGAACKFVEGDNLTPNGGVDTITSFHGQAYLETTGEFALATNPKYYAVATITGVTNDGTGKFTVTYKVTTKAGTPVLGLAAPQANLAKLASFTDGSGIVHTTWVPYIQTYATAGTGNWPNSGTAVASCLASREKTGAFAEVGGGVYTYTFSKAASAYTCNGAATTTYEPTLTHRVSVMMGGHSGATADANFDFVPDGSAVSLTRNLMGTDACTQCHGPQFDGHGGDRLTMDNCVTCHNGGGGFDPQGGESIDMGAMIHKIHAGAELSQVSGPDGLYYDNAATTADEAADNGEYAIWGNSNSKHSWHGEFPAVLANCTKCHYGTGAQVDNWKTVPSRAACGACHDAVDFENGVNHATQTNDNGCAFCHADTDVVAYHDWTTKDVRNIPEFDLEVSVSAPANGKWFVAGEQPVATIIVKKDGVAIDHTTFVADTNKDGCTLASCPAGDGKFAASNMYITGPRANRMAALGYPMRAKVLASKAGTDVAPATYDLSAATSLIVLVDNGQGVAEYNENHGDECDTGVITVTVPATGTFASKAAATDLEIMAWLNADAKFAARAVAYRDEISGKLAIRSRNLGALHSIQLKASTVATAVFGVAAGANDTIKFAGSGTNLAKPANGVATDPFISYFADRIEYKMDKVDDLQPGTYIVDLQISDIGNNNSVVPGDYRTPSVAWTSFDVNPDDVATLTFPEKQVAGNCDSCHQTPDGKGFVLDFPRHNKQFSDDAIDHCAACHDNAPATATGGTFSGGGVMIAQRVHSVHMGSELMYPLTTVQHEDGTPGREWQIEYPMDIRNCESCHPASTSGSWKSMPSRLACFSCHDGDDAKAHMKMQTYDPTPANAFSGDETESCGTCH